MNDCVDLPRDKSRPQRFSIGEIGVDKRGPGYDSAAMTFVKAVINNDVVAVSQQLFGDYAADITGATGY